MEQMKKRLMPLATNGSMMRAPDMMMDSVSASYRVTDGGTLNLMGQSCGEYNINEMGLERKKTALDDSAEGGLTRDVSYRCASHEMLVFNTIGWGASSTVRKAIHIPHHRIVALKKINSADRDKRQQLLKEIKTLCESQQASANHGLVEFYGAFYAPDSGQVSIALEYMDGGSLADIVRVVKKIPEPILSKITQKVLAGLSFLHQVRHLVHRDIKPANLLINLNGEPKITDFGISAGLDNSVAMCATFVGTVTYMSPERINNEPYSFPADVWSLGLTLLECGTGIFPYNATTGPVNLMLQVMYDPSPTPAPDQFSPEFCDFVDACLRKDADSRPTAEQLLQHPFITKYAMDDRQLAEYVNNVFDPAQRLKDLSDMLTTHYYSLFDGTEAMFGFLKELYRDESALVVGGEPFNGQQTIFDAHCELQRLLNKPDEKWVHVINSLECCGYGDRGVMIRVTGSIAVGSQFTPANGTAGAAEGGPPPLEIRTGPVRGSFSELFVFEPSKEVLGSFWISRQETHLQL